LTVVAEAVVILRERGKAAALAHLQEGLGIDESQAREILYVASHPDPRSLAGRI
jgi:hypothetical protein